MVLASPRVKGIDSDEDCYFYFWLCSASIEISHSNKNDVDQHSNIR